MVEVAISTLAEPNGPGRPVALPRLILSSLPRDMILALGYLGIAGAMSDEEVATLVEPVEGIHYHSRPRIGRPSFTPPEKETKRNAGAPKEKQKEAGKGFTYRQLADSLFSAEPLVGGRGTSRISRYDTDAEQLRGMGYEQLKDVAIGEGLEVVEMPYERLNETFPHPERYLGRRHRGYLDGRTVYVATGAGFDLAQTLEHELFHWFKPKADHRDFPAHLN